MIPPQGNRQNQHEPGKAIADVITGYRADDSFFSFARAFLSNTISYNQLQQVLRYGDLGMQYVIISSKAYDSLTYKKSEIIDGEVYCPMRKKRDLRAREEYRRLVRRLDRDGLFLNQIIRGELTDECLQ